MAAAGSIVVDMLMRTGSFETDSKRAEKRLRDFNKSAVAAGKVLGSALASGAGAAAGAFALFAKNTIEAEQVQAQLMARLDDTAGAAGRSLEQLNKMADTLSAMTVFDDEAIGGAQALLLTFKQIEGVNFDDTTAAVLDLATVTGKDLNTAALQLGKALNDPVKGIAALGKAGIQFSEDQQKLIKRLAETGDVAGAQRVILKQLEGQMGTAAEAARDTLGGALQALENAAMNALEGDSGSAGLKGLRMAVEDMTDTLNDPETREGINSLMEGLARIANLAVQASSKIGQFGADVANTFSDVPDLEFQAGAIKSMKELIADRDKTFDPDTFLFGSSRLREDLKEMEAQYAKAQASGIGRLLEQEARARAQIDRVAAGLGKSAPAVGVDIDPDEPEKPAGRAGGGRSPRARKPDKPRDLMADFRDEDQAALERLIETEARAREELDRLSATYSGPLAEAEYQHMENLKHIEELGKLAGAGSAEVAKLKDQEAAAYGKVTEAIDKQAKQMEMLEQIQFMDRLRDDAADALTNIALDFDNALEHATDFFESLAAMITRAIAEQWIEKLIGKRGDEGGGSFGDSLGGLLGGFLSFGGARAAGGDVWPNSAFLVGENGPEMFVPRTAGVILPAELTASAAGMGGRTSFAQQVNITVQGRPNRETMHQLEARTYKAGVRATRRGG